MLHKLSLAGKFSELADTDLLELWYVAISCDENFNFLSKSAFCLGIHQLRHMPIPKYSLHLQDKLYLSGLSPPFCANIRSLGPCFLHSLRPHARICCRWSAAERGDARQLKDIAAEEPKILNLVQTDEAFILSELSSKGKDAKRADFENLGRALNVDKRACACDT
jgi:hypothetical protein